MDAYSLAGGIAAITLFFLFVNPDYRPGVYGVTIWFGLSLAYFGLYARHRMVLSPEERFALKATAAHEMPGQGQDGQASGPDDTRSEAEVDESR